MRVDDKQIAKECNKRSSSQLFAAGGWGQVVVQDGLGALVCGVVLPLRGGWCSGPGFCLSHGLVVV